MSKQAAPDLIETPLRAARAEPTMPEGTGYRMRGAGSTLVDTDPQTLWDIVMDERRLASAIPGAETLHRDDIDGHRTYAADIGIGVGFVKGTYRVTAQFRECIEPRALVLFGGARGPLGNSSGEGWVDLVADGGCTRVNYAYAIVITGVVAKVGGRLLDAAAGKLIEKFFVRLVRSVDADGPGPVRIDA